MGAQTGIIDGRDWRAVEERLGNDDLIGLLSMVRGDRSGDAPQVALTRWSCPSCSQAEYLSVSELSYSRDTKNELKHSTRSLAKNLVLPSSAREKFTERFGPPPGDVTSR
jgi:hypothetical protein